MQRGLVNMSISPEEKKLRDEFAGQAMIALMSNEAWVAGMNSHAAHEDMQFKTALARHSWTMADAMLAEREQNLPVRASELRAALRNLMFAADRERTSDIDDAEAAAKLYMQRREEASALLAKSDEATP